MSATNPVPVLEVGGTHVTAALVDPRTWTVLGAPARLALDSAAAAADILGTLARAGRSIGAPECASWGVAMPDPFDYERGVGRFRGVAKFEALYGVDVGAALGEGLPRPTAVRFLNDADAFALGEWTHGAAAGTARSVGLTLGTGVGSGWVADGRIADPGVPPGGRIHRLTVDGLPLENFMSRRAIRRAYAAATGDEHADVREIAERARGGDADACAVLSRALRVLGSALGPPARAFGAEVVMIGGSMAASWSLFEPWFLEGAGTGIPIALAADAGNAPLIGAAGFVVGSR